MSTQTWPYSNPSALPRFPSCPRPILWCIGANKLVTRLNQQIALAQDPNFALTRQKWVEGDNGKELRETKKRVRPWWRVIAASDASHNNDKMTF